MRYRQLLFFLALAMCTSFANGQNQNPLFIPDTLSGTVFDLNMAPSTMQFRAGTPTETYGINQDYLGPTMIFNSGDFITLNVTNNLPDTSTMHWHGMHVSAMDDGGPHTKIFPGDTWSPDFTVLDEATTFWYHPHLHHKTAFQVYHGAAGMIIVRDENEASLSLPRTYGVDDFPLIIQDKSFDENNQLVFENLSDSVMVNGTFNPYLEVPAQMVRFRMLNAANQRVFNFVPPPGLPAFQIASDGGLLEQPIPITRMRLAPGERAEVVIDFSGSSNLNFLGTCNNSELGNGISGGPGSPGGPPTPLDGNDFSLIQFRVRPPTANPVTMLSPNLNTIEAPDPADADRVRTKYFDTDANGFFAINSMLFSMDHMNDTILLGDTEIWEIVNVTDIAHPFHIHDVQFHIIYLNGLPIPPHLRGRKDVILVTPGDSIRFIAIFEDFADDVVPYMYHCHNLFHEDAGMMAQFLVVENPLSIENDLLEDANPRFGVYPNPTNDKLIVHPKEGIIDQDLTIEVLNVWGQRLQAIDVRLGVSEVDIQLDAYPTGIYLLNITDEDGRKEVIRVMKQ